MKNFSEPSVVVELADRNVVLHKKLLLRVLSTGEGTILKNVKNKKQDKEKRWRKENKGKKFRIL